MPPLLKLSSMKINVDSNVCFCLQLFVIDLETDIFQIAFNIPIDILDPKRIWIIAVTKQNFL